MMIGVVILLFVAGSAVIRKIRNRQGPALSCTAAAFGFLGLAICLFWLALGPIGISRFRQLQYVGMQNCRTIALAEFQYANDHDGRYPDGKSSTEAFQLLLDGNYVADPELFFVSMPGKTPAKMGERLRPENVGYDMTSGVDSSAPKDLPLVFSTGYRVDYRPGSAAISLTVPYSPFIPRKTWWEWLNFSSPTRAGDRPMIAVAYYGMNAFLKPVDVLSPRPGEVDNFVPRSFSSGGQAYRQLTPNGQL